jgi:hypothetical protein
MLCTVACSNILFGVQISIYSSLYEKILLAAMNSYAEYHLGKQHNIIKLTIIITKMIFCL